MHFQALHFQTLRFHFQPREIISFPEGHSANLLRGAFGDIFRKLVCSPDCPSAASCPHRSTCPYAQIFSPGQTADVPSGFADWPRPFVFRAAHLDGQTIAAAQPFYFDMHLFDQKRPLEQYITQAFEQLAVVGFGPGRHLVDLLRVHSSAVTLSLQPASTHVKSLTVRFLTPTELKSAGKLITSPDFGTLAARVRDRISALSQLYGDGALPIDFKGFGERASQVRMTRCDVHPVSVTRRSTRTGQVHSIGGFVGEAEYAGDLDEFVPWLQAAHWTGVGRQTVWGKGMLEIKLPLPARQ